MAIKHKNLPTQKTDLEAVVADLDKGLNKFTKDKLSDQSLPDLILGYCDLEGKMINAKLQQCKIIREIRTRFPDNVSFGEYCKSNAVPAIVRELNPDTRTRMIQVADFFENRMIDGFSWSVAIALAQPKYAEANISESIYQEIRGGGISAIEVKNRLEELYVQKKITHSSTIEGEFKAVSNERAVAELATTESSQAIIADDQKNDESYPEVIPLKLDNIEALEDAFIKLCEPFSVMDILSLLRRLIRKFQQKPASKQFAPKNQ